MRFLLVNPHYPISETPSPPLGIAYLAAALERMDVDVRVLDYVVFPYAKKDLEKILTEFNPHLFGVTAVSMTFHNAINIINDAKTINPELITVMGGPHATFQAEEILHRYASLDIVVRGEGEASIAALVDTIKHEKGWDKVSGIVFRDKTGIRTTANGSPIAVDTLPLPARHLLPLGRYRALGMPISMTTSRGCPFGCIFCVGRRMSGAKVRYRPAAQVVNELATLSTLGFHQVNLADDLFTAAPKHCLSVCHDIIHRKISPSWTAFARVDTITPDILSAMRQAGCHTISFGVESGNPDMLKRIKKGITLNQVLHAAQICREAGICAHGSFILGLPGETENTLNDTLDFAKQLEALGMQCGFHLLAPFPGTDIFIHRHRYDIQFLSENWREYHANRAVTRTASVSQERLNSIVQAWEEDFLIRLGEIKTQRAKGTAHPDDAQMLTKLEHTVRIYDWMMDRSVERKGSWKASANSIDKNRALERLAQSLNGSNPADAKAVRDTLRYARKNGYLGCTTRDNTLRWAWRN